MKPVLYNIGGHVAHISIKVNTTDSFDAFGVAAKIARQHEGNVEAIYEDNKWGQRTRILGVEKAGLVLEFGTMEEHDEALREITRLRSAIEEYLLWEPRKAGHAEAHRRLSQALKEEEE